MEVPWPPSPAVSSSVDSQAPTLKLGDHLEDDCSSVVSEDRLLAQIDEDLQTEDMQDDSEDSDFDVPEVSDLEDEVPTSDEEVGPERLHQFGNKRFFVRECGMGCGNTLWKMKCSPRPAAKRARVAEELLKLADEPVKPAEHAKPAEPAEPAEPAFCVVPASSGKPELSREDAIQKLIDSIDSQDRCVA